MSVDRIRHAQPGSREEPLLGWRLWRVRGERLESWAANHAWEPGSNEAQCFAPVRRCRHSPGRGCLCGFWGLFDPLAALARGRAERAERSSVLGLIQGWGEVAVHGGEGFRSSHASVVCLFTDWLWDAATMPCPERGLSRRWWRLQRRLGYVPRPVPADAWRVGAVRAAAGAYGVPILSLRKALDAGLLRELGADERMLRRVRSWLDAVAAGRLHSRGRWR